MTEPLLETGRILNTHGVRGEVKLESWADSPQALAALKTLYLGEKPFRVLESRVHGPFVLMRLEGVDSLEAAMALKGRVVKADRAEFTLPEGSVFLQDLLGLAVRGEDGQALGTLADILEYPAGHVYVVRGQDGERLIPEKGGFVRDIDLEAGVITVRLIEGM